MTIFQYLNSILFSKKKIDVNCDDESQFNLFMVNRWTSMYSKELNEYVNETTNKYWNLFDDKLSQYNYVYSVFPRLKFKICGLFLIEKFNADKCPSAISITCIKSLTPVPSIVGQSFPKIFIFDNSLLATKLIKGKILSGVPF